MRIDTPAQTLPQERKARRGHGPRGRKATCSMDVIRKGARAVGRVPHSVGAPTMGAEMGQRPPILRWELHGRVLALARAVAIAIVTLTLIAYIHWLPRWIDERLNE